MALIKFGAIITDSRGSIGGHTFKMSHYGNIALPKTQPPKSLSARASLVHANFSRLTKQWWNILTPTQRADWRALAAANPRPNRWGNLFPLTGLAFYISLNRRLAQAGLPETNDAPSDQFVAGPATATLTISAPSTAEIAWTTPPLATDHILVAYITGPRSPGENTFAGRFSYLAASALSQGSPWDVSSDFLLRFGTILNTRQYALELATLNTANAAQSPPVATASIAT